MIVRWSRVRRVTPPIVSFGGTRDVRGPVLFFGVGVTEGPIADQVDLYDAPITNDARKIGRWGWANANNRQALFWWPVLLRDGLRLVIAPAVHDATLLYV